MNKGYANNEARQANFAQALSNIITSGLFVIMLPNHQPWGTEKIAQNVVNRLPPNEKKYVLIAPSPQEDPFLHKYLLDKADIVFTVEGGLMHLAYNMGRPLIVLSMPESGNLERWFPIGADLLQRIIRPPQDIGEEGISIIRRLPLMTNEGDSLCLTPDSLIQLADGSQKPLIELSATKSGGSAFGGKPFPNLRGLQGKEGADMVLSLNEATGKLEPHRVLALLDMGVKPVYRIATASGKTLKTTLTHPYLTRDGWKKLSQIKVGEEVAVVKEINGHVLSLPYSGGQETLKLAQKPRIQKPITGLTSLISFLFGLNKDATGKEYQTRNRKEDFQYRREFFKEIARQANSKNRFSQIRNYLGNKFSAILGYSLHQRKIYHMVKGLSRLFSIPKVEASQIKETFPNSDILWDKIVSIEPLGPMPVYDIEVEATHNFIAQGIVAHNTYSQKRTENGGQRTEVGSPLEENKGGIDLNPANLNIEVIGEGGVGSSPLNPIPFDLKNFQGFSFQIISVRPVEDWETAFGLPSPEIENLVS